MAVATAAATALVMTVMVAVATAALVAILMVMATAALVLTLVVGGVTKLIGFLCQGIRRAPYISSRAIPRGRRMKS